MADVGDHVDTPSGPGKVVGRYWERNRWSFGRHLPNRLWLIVQLEGGGRKLVPPEKATPRQLTLADPEPERPPWA